MQVNCTLLNQRFGHRQRLLVTFEQKQLRIDVSPGMDNLTFFLDPDPGVNDLNEGWTGAYGGLLQWLMNDGMTHPASLTSRLRVLWNHWHAGDVDESEAERVLSRLFTWVDAVNLAEPMDVRDYR